MGYLIDTRPDEDTFAIIPIDEQLDDLDDSEIVELSDAVQEQMEKRELAPPSDDAEDKTEEPTTGAALVQDAFDTLADAMSGADDKLAVEAARVVITNAEEVGKCAEILMACQGSVSREDAS